MFPLADADFGGYVTGMPTRRGGKKGGDDIDAKNDDWNEETVVWTDYADADGRGAMKFLPDDNDPGGRWSSSTVVVVDEITTGIRTRMPRNPEYGRFEGTVKAMEWIEADVTDAVRDAMFDTTAEDDDDEVNGDDNEAEDGGEETAKKKKRSMSLMISTNSIDGVIYASKEDWSGNGPYLELRFELRGLSVASPPTLEPSRSPVAPLVRPFKPNEAGGIDEMTPIVGEFSIYIFFFSFSHFFECPISSHAPKSIRRPLFFVLFRVPFVSSFAVASTRPPPPPRRGHQHHLRRVLLLPNDPDRHRDRPSSRSSPPSRRPTAARRFFPHVPRGKRGARHRRAPHARVRRGPVDRADRRVARVRGGSRPRGNFDRHGGRFERGDSQELIPRHG